MTIGIDASFLRKPGTGIGQVTEQTLRALGRLPGSAEHRFLLYLEEDTDISFLPENFEKRVFLPRWTRDDVPRRILWERSLPVRVLSGGCETFISMSQSSAVFPKGRVRHVMVVHDIIPFLFPAYRGRMTNRLHVARILHGIERADRIVAVSGATKRDLSLNLGIPEGRISVAYPDCAPRFREPVTQAETDRVLGTYALSPGYLYHGGGLEVRKNTGRLLEAYAELRSRRGDVPPLVISGRVHSGRNPLATDVGKELKRLGLGDSVRLLGFVPDADLPALYASARAFLFPSLYEGFGLPIVEAMAVGTPVLAGFGAGSVPEVSGDAVLLVEPDKVDEIGKGIERLLDDDAYREALVSKGRERVRAFSWETFATGLIRVATDQPEHTNLADI
ncbi:MAG: glycosyltransferase family 4 protein [Candidatus Moranbacteria bacterium]|nr:glycosyltransferase family 4 protein [Candidatus Moranbacteria bacterium]